MSVSHVVPAGLFIDGLFLPFGVFKSRALGHIVLVEERGILSSPRALLPVLSPFLLSGGEKLFHIFSLDPIIPQAYVIFGLSCWCFIPYCPVFHENC